MPRLIPALKSAMTLPCYMCGRQSPAVNTYVDQDSYGPGFICAPCVEASDYLRAAIVEEV